MNFFGLFSQSPAMDTPPSLPTYSTAFSLPASQPPSLQSKTILSKSEVRNRIKGLLFGAALGDAMGLATEFLTKAQAKHVYPSFLPVSFKTFIRDGHRNRWNEGDFTDDTDQMLLIIHTLLASNSLALNPLVLAANLRTWVHEGIPSLQKRACGIGMSVGQAIRSEDFLTNPSNASFKVWQRSKFQLAANGAVMRTAILGVPFFWDEGVVVKQTVDAAMVTHADPRCILSCIVVTLLVSRMLQGKLGSLENEDSLEAVETVVPLNAVKYNPTPIKSLGQDETCTALIREILEEYNDPIMNMYKDPTIPFDVKHHVSKIESHVFPDSLQSLELDQHDSIGYTLKCLGSAAYCFSRSFHPKNLDPFELKEMEGFGNDYKGELFKRIVLELVMEAGDADTNACVAGALLGCRIGFNSLPKDWLDGLQHKEYLEKMVDDICRLMDGE
ncbi:UNVERIFIED_CONTAM: hypothetical protein HDU68_009790 [Siphonaria sp. JEL0065]|nr:hypothetical protein HDU68_009790 [Siphonaria sp. JEL0065]